MYLRGDPYETSDAVFGVKESLVVDMGKVADEAMAKNFGVPLGIGLWHYDFVLVSDEEASALREQKAREAMEKQGKKMRFVGGLPVPDVE